jgi:uncharacterized membrane protein YbhN (UPF0104 family)
MIAAATLLFLYQQLFFGRDLSTVLGFIEEMKGQKNLYFNLNILLLLMVVNHSLEAYKWQLLIQKLEKVHFWLALRAVFTGISVSMFLPNRVGDYLGRVFMLRTANPVKSILVTIIGSIAQLLSTVLAGLLAAAVFLYYRLDFYQATEKWLFTAAVFSIIFLVFFALFVYFNVKLVKPLAETIFPRWKDKITAFLDVFTYFSRHDLFKVLSISLLRYIVFSFQFYLLLRLFGIGISYAPAMMLIALVYLIITVIPTIALSELGVRGSVSVYIFSLYLGAQGHWDDGKALAVFAASTGIWLINLALPALLGVFFVYRLKFFKRRTGNA